MCFRYISLEVVSRIDLKVRSRLEIKMWTPKHNDGSKASRI